MKRLLVRTPVLGYLVLFLYRLRIAAGLVFSLTFSLSRWLITSNEFTNYTYALSDRNIDELAEFVSIVTGESSSIISGYVSEIQQDEKLRNHLATKTAALPAHAGADRVAHYGRRIGWYAMVRALKPRLVVESGIDKGLGTCVLAAALMKNKAEGATGTLLAIDINPEAGALVGGDYSPFVNLVYEDSFTALEQMTDQIDLFIHDSDHSCAHEAGEYKRITNLLSDRSIVISDNAHVSPELYRFARRIGRRYLFWQERPVRHFYAGAGIGVAARFKLE